MLLLAAWPVPVLAVTPLGITGVVLVAVVLPLFYWHWYGVLQQLQQNAALTITDNSQLHWFNSNLPPGRLLPGGLVSQHMLRLQWQADTDQRCYRKWIFADQCSEMQFRALARAISQQNWQSGSGV
ncbi:protein YgfX [Rheinheimera oceanensis]|uniref:protein YgfX n=1 Tax=Rheinheimera oceanensis TaxID=2817449 RepID=UPI001BFD953E|nr:protein YgfX [Rheinheimera oceanensis]